MNDLLLPRKPGGPLKEVGSGAEPITEPKFVFSRKSNPLEEHALLQGIIC
jgi:hypothetical protein